LNDGELRLHIRAPTEALLAQRIALRLADPGHISDRKALGALSLREVAFLIEDAGDLCFLESAAGGLADEVRR
jgi:hypothetical protein